MQYAQVIINHKAGYEPLTYSVPAELLAYLAIGSVVLVPFGPQQLHGVVVKFVRSVDEAIKPKLRPINRVIYEGTFIAPQTIEAVLNLQKQYGYGAGETLFALLPEWPKTRQKNEPNTHRAHANFRCIEWILPPHERAVMYQNLAKRLQNTNQSLLILCQNHATVQALATIFPAAITFPETPTPKAKRDFYFKTRALQKPSVVIGTRAALCTPLTEIGAVIIDDLWLPGHKEDNSPRWWSTMAAKALCQTHGIPLYVASSIPWPDTQLLAPHKQYGVITNLGELKLAPKRNHSEVVHAFLAEQEDTPCTIIVRETYHDTWWCPRCRQSIDAEHCTRCGNAAVFLPRLSLHSLQQLVGEHANVQVVAATQFAKFTQAGAALVLGFDAFLSITDYRAEAYLATLITNLRSQFAHVSLVTAMPDEWARVAQKDRAYFTASAQERTTHQLPPSSYAVAITAKDKNALEKTVTTLKSTDMVLKISKVQPHRDEFRLSLLTKKQPLPANLFKSNDCKVDILPLYIE